jgi:hypothetical protein
MIAFDAPYVEIGNMDVIRGLLIPFAVPVIDIGDDLPDRSGEPS